MIAWAASICTSVYGSISSLCEACRLHCKTAGRMQLLVHYLVSTIINYLINEPWNHIQWSSQHSGPLYLLSLCPPQITPEAYYVDHLGPGHYSFSKWAVEEWGENDNIQGDVNKKAILSFSSEVTLYSPISISHYVLENHCTTCPVHRNWWGMQRIGSNNFDRQVPCHGFCIYIRGALPCGNVCIRSC